jgi:hypothetical protein
MLHLNKTRKKEIRTKPLHPDRTEENFDRIDMFAYIYYIQIKHKKASAEETH